ncbi:hypothetical protein CCAX7_62780 [Capsulimonas corticalis]|uniref:Uncharacterized protein n=1 Tax=Capsulimonas corticalis TaxID=2219043 RepID=A0A402CWQ4_9BACT|nr:hypothetical protein CCAX7_62780 [Capsulimonas corticalis]
MRNKLRIIVWPVGNVESHAGGRHDYLIIAGAAALAATGKFHRTAPNNDDRGAIKDNLRQRNRAPQHNAGGRSNGL